MTSQPGQQRITIHILLNISQIKCNQTMKFCQLIEYPKRKNYVENEAGKLVPDRFLFFKKSLYQVKASGLQLDFTISRQLSNQHIIETNCLKLYTVDPDIFLILVFQIGVWGQFLHHILCMTFQQKYSTYYILLTDQISLSGYFLRYWAICVLQLFVNEVVTSWILKLTLSF